MVFFLITITICFGQIIELSLKNCELKEQNNDLLSEVILNQKQITKLKTDLSNANAVADQLFLDNQKITLTDQELKLTNALLVEKNQKLETAIVAQTNQQNSMIEMLSKAFQSGYLKPSKTGFTPVFKFSSEPVDKEVQQETLTRLSNGSYSYQLEVVTFSLEDVKSWRNLGKWDFTGYRAVPKECDFDPTTTASGDLSTPGYTLGVDPKIWPYGTIFYVEDLGFVQAADCGGGFSGSNAGDFMVASDVAYLITGSHNVWLVYSPQS